jgi:MFS family permease
MADKFGRSFMMLFGQAARGMIFFILALMVYIGAPFRVFAVLLMINTMVGGAFQVGADAYLVDISTEAERPVFYSHIRMGYNLGWALGPMTGAFFADTPFWFFFIVTGLLCMGGTLFTWVNCCKKNPAQSVSAMRRRPAVSGGMFKVVMAQEGLLLLLAGALFYFTLSSQLYSTMSVFSVNQVKISNEALGSIYSLNGFMVLLLQVPVTHWLNKVISVRKQLLIGVAWYGCGFAALGWANGAWWIAGCVAVLTVGEILVQPSLYAVISRNAVSDNAGRTMAAFSLARGVGYAVGPYAGAQLMQHSDSPVLLWLTLGSCAAISISIFAAVFLRQKT